MIAAGSICLLRKTACSHRSNRTCIGFGFSYQVKIIMRSPSLIERSVGPDRSTHRATDRQQVATGKIAEELKPCWRSTLEGREYALPDAFKPVSVQSFLQSISGIAQVPSNYGAISRAQIARHCSDGRSQSPGNLERIGVVVNDAGEQQHDAVERRQIAKRLTRSLLLGVDHP
jgi:hypothetical protein